MSLTWNEFVKLELLKLDFTLAFDHDNKSVGSFVEEFFIHFWLEEVDLLEVVVIELDNIAELFSDDSADDVVQGLRNVSLLATVERLNVNNFFFMFVENLG